jgi:ferric-dicitrate binding protein FerR (iron transport regulator)
MEKNSQDLQTLIEKMEKGSITSTERQLLFDWYDQLNSKDPDIWEFEGQQAEIRQEMLSGIETGIRRKRVALLYKVVRWSAAAVFLGLFSLWIFQHNILSEKNRHNKNNEPAFFVFANDGANPKKIILSDSSIVWLNSGSHLRIDAGFGKENRLVQADGEILLNIYPDKTRPFRIVTRNVTTTVLGTLFNIEAYTNERELKISLLKGRVLVADSMAGVRTLEPGQTAVSKGSGRLYLTTHDNSNAGNWIHGALVFNDALLTDALHRMERKYSIRFDYDPGLFSDQRITTIVQEGSDWKAALKSMIFIYNIQYKKTDQFIRLYR